MIKTKVALLAASLFIANASASFAEPTDIDECYGETLEIQIYMFAPDQPNGGQVIMSLPSPASWTLIGRDGRGSLHDAGCQEEPVPVNQAYSSGMQNKFSATLNKIGAPGALRDVISLSLTGGLKEATSEGIYKQFHTTRDLSEIPHGFLRLNSKSRELVMSYGGRTFVAGLFYFPEHYQTPVGHPVEANCSRFGFCRVDYRLHDRLGVKYRFRSSIEYDTKWVPQDQALRALINSWVTD